MHLVRHKLGTQRALALLSLSFLCGYLLSCCLLELLTCTSSPGIGIENDSERQYRSTLLKPTDLLVLVWLDPIRVKEVPPAEHCGAFTHGHIEKKLCGAALVTVDGCLLVSPRLRLNKKTLQESR